MLGIETIQGIKKIRAERPLLDLDAASEVD